MTETLISKTGIEEMFLEIKHSHENKHWPHCPGLIQSRMTLKRSSDSSSLKIPLTLKLFSTEICGRKLHELIFPMRSFDLRR